MRVRLKEEISIFRALMVTSSPALAYSYRRFRLFLKLKKQEGTAQFLRQISVQRFQ